MIPTLTNGTTTMNHNGYGKSKRRKYVQRINYNCFGNNARICATSHKQNVSHSFVRLLNRRMGTWVHVIDFDGDFQCSGQRRKTRCVEVAEASEMVVGESKVPKAKSQWGGAKVIHHLAMRKVVDSPSVAWSVRSRISTLIGESVLPKLSEWIAWDSGI
jgi:hypothetical protein